MEGKEEGVLSYLGVLYHMGVFEKVTWLVVGQLASCLQAPEC